ncbi:MAG: hypothetical protein DHS20C08_13540 [Rhodomicrobium sp.]|nr:MAG: hypothetical protein DHS20C08_13540 [Rhodomicrobium sp.]
MAAAFNLVITYDSQLRVADYDRVGNGYGGVFHNMWKTSELEILAIIYQSPHQLPATTRFHNDFFTFADFRLHETSPERQAA